MGVRPPRIRRQVEFTQKAHGWQGVRFPATPSAQPVLSFLLLGFHLLRIETVSCLLHLSASYLPGPLAERQPVLSSLMSSVFIVCFRNQGARGTF